MVDAYVLFVMCVVDASWGSVSKEMKIVYVDVVGGCVIVCVQFFKICWWFLYLCDDLQFCGSGYIFAYDVDVACQFF